MKICAPFSLLVILTGIAILIVLPFILHREITRRMRLTKGSTLYENWRMSRSGTIVEFYFFTVSNIKEFMRGDKPIVIERGPYTYEQTTSKFSLDAFPQNGTVRYADTNTFIFLPNRSVGRESDNITVLNLGYVAIAAYAGLNPALDIVASHIIHHYYNSELFFNRTVFEMIWGYEDPALKFISKFVSVQTSVGLYANKNESVSSLLEVSDGVLDAQSVGNILTVAGKKELDVWKTPEANAINGSDGSLFPQFLTPQSTVHLFSPDICRSLNFETEQHGPPHSVFVDSVSTTRFVLANENFLSPEEYPDNRGFCLDYPKCPKSGVVDLRTCMRGAPIAVSLPHFNGANPSYREAVEGMHPRDDMGIFLYIEPQSGVILLALQMVQVNAMLHANPRFTELAHLPPEVFLPIGYINTTIHVDPSVARTLITTLIVPEMSANVVAWLLISAGLMSTAVLLVRLCVLNHRRRVLVEPMDESSRLLSEDTLQVSETPPGEPSRPQRQDLIDAQPARFAQVEVIVDMQEEEDTIKRTIH